MKAVAQPYNALTLKRHNKSSVIAVSPLFSDCCAVYLSEKTADKVVFELKNGLKLKMTKPLSFSFSLSFSFCHLSDVSKIRVWRPIFTNHTPSQHTRLAKVHSCMPIMRFFFHLKKNINFRNNTIKHQNTKEQFKTYYNKLQQKILKVNIQKLNNFPKTRSIHEDLRLRLRTPILRPQACAKVLRVYL